jgi:cytidine deaminase
MDLTLETVHRLVAAAAAIRDRAYAPYSHFRVGAALLLADNEVVAGCNVENASFGLSVCAERNALAAAVAGGASRFLALAVVTDASPPASPCGACRQVLAEFGDYPVILANTANERRLTSVVELLPEAFSGAALPRPPHVS